MIKTIQDMYNIVKNDMVYEYDGNWIRDNLKILADNEKSHEDFKDVAIFQVRFLKDVLKDISETVQNNSMNNDCVQLVEQLQEHLKRLGDLKL